MPTPYKGNLDSAFVADNFIHDAAEDQQRQRPISAQARLHHLTSKGTAQPPLAFYSFSDQNFDKMESFDKGHLIANEFINENKEFNIVPMYSSFNQSGGTWKQMEGALLTQVKAGQHVDLSITIQYNNPDTRVPSGFVVTAKCDAGYVNFNGVDINNLPIAHLPVGAVALSETDLFEQVGEDVVRQVWMATHMANYFDFEAEKHLPKFDYRIQKNNGGSLAAESDIPRPYAFLDWFWLVDPDANPVKTYLKRCIWVGGQDFRERQKTLVRLVNRLRNGGFLKSDYPNDTKTALIEGSGKEAAQIDHVWPQAKYGPNLFSNALVASGNFNNQASAKDAVEKYKNFKAV